MTNKSRKKDEKKKIANEVNKSIATRQKHGNTHSATTMGEKGGEERETEEKVRESEGKRGLLVSTTFSLLASLVHFFFISVM